jgi:hypothetical protein
MHDTYSVQWTDRGGVTHSLRQSHDLTTTERSELDLLRQQLQLSASILDAEYTAPMVAQARPNMVRMILRILLPSLAEEEIAAFDSSVGDGLLSQWWAIANAAT